MKLMSIDPGFKRLGFAIFDEEANIVHNGVYSNRDRHNKEPYQQYLNEGIFSMYHWFGDLVEEYNITHVISEIVPPVSGKGNFGSSPQIPLVLSVMAIAKIIAYEDAIEWIDIPARTVKNLIVGDSSASKAVVRRIVLSEYPEIQRERKITDIPFDETDAISIGMSYFPDLHHGEKT
jgi:Holliday junction resolvasome RuvABC endonuclease subunit